MSRWILLRGLLREQRHWGGFAGQLQHALPGAQVLTPDLPGNGSRWRETSPSSISAMVDQIRAALPERGGEPLYLLGLSMGGMLAIDWAHAFPGEVAGIVLINTSTRPHASLTQRLRPGAWPSLLRLPLQSRVARERTILALSSAHAANQTATLARWQAIARDAPVSVANGLRQLWAAARFRAPPAGPPVPALLLASAADRLVDPACSRRMSAAWGMPLHLHPDAGHDLPLDDPAWVALQVGDWLRARPSRAP